MDQEDMEKTTFVNPWGTFCYKVMPFGLNNGGATYQRVMVTLFHDMTQTEKEYLDNLERMFKRLRKLNLRLNPNKCTFRVRSGKLLGFIVNQRGIEVDLEKVKPIQAMPPPKIEKEI